MTNEPIHAFGRSEKKEEEIRNSDSRRHSAGGAECGDFVVQISSLYEQVLTRLFTRRIFHPPLVVL
jgi:hypothetical protein